MKACTFSTLIFLSTVMFCSNALSTEYLKTIRYTKADSPVSSQSSEFIGAQISRVNSTDNRFSTYYGLKLDYNLGASGHNEKVLSGFIGGDIGLKFTSTGGTVFTVGLAPGIVPERRCQGSQKSIFCELTPVFVNFIAGRSIQFHSDIDFPISRTSKVGMGYMLTKYLGDDQHWISVGLQF